MNASDARKAVEAALAADELKRQEAVAEAKALEAREVAYYQKEVDLLFNHFKELIVQATKNKKMEIEKTKFTKDRFPAVVVNEVVRSLREQDYKVTLTENNAQNTIIFNISW